jgi:hypothetical protein
MTSRLSRAISSCSGFICPWPGDAAGAGPKRDEHRDADKCNTRLGNLGWHTSFTAIRTLALRQFSVIVYITTTGISPKMMQTSSSAK